MPPWDKAKQLQIAASGGKNAHALGRAHEWTSEEARRAGRLSGRTRRSTTRIYNMTPDAMRSHLLTLLQDFRKQCPGQSVSFANLGRELGQSRQYIRTLYYQLKKDHPLPPVASRGVVSKDKHINHTPNHDNQQ